MVSGSLEAIDPWAAQRKKSFQYGDLSGIRPRSPCFVVPSPREGGSLQDLPDEYADRTDPYSPTEGSEPLKSADSLLGNPCMDGSSSPPAKKIDLLSTVHGVSR